MTLIDRRKDTAMSTTSEILGLLEKFPAWKRIVDSPAKIEALEKRIAAIEAKLSGGGEKCPSCGEYNFKVVNSIPHPILGDIGGVERTYECKACGFSEKKLIE